MTRTSHSAFKRRSLSSSDFLLSSALAFHSPSSLASSTIRLSAASNFLCNSATTADDESRSRSTFAEDACFSRKISISLFKKPTCFSNFVTCELAIMLAFAAMEDSSSCSSAIDEISCSATCSFFLSSSVSDPAKSAAVSKPATFPSNDKTSFLALLSSKTCSERSTSMSFSLAFAA